MDEVGLAQAQPINLIVLWWLHTVNLHTAKKRLLFWQLQLLSELQLLT